MLANENKDFLEEDFNGKWILETKGDDNDIRYFNTEEKARQVMEDEYNEILEDHECYMVADIYDNDAYIGDTEFYQSWKIYKKKSYLNKVEELIDKINIELDRAYDGVTQYSFELMDTSVATDNIFEAEKLLKELEELIK